MVYINVAVCLSMTLLIVGLSYGLTTSSFKGSDVLDLTPLIDGHNDLPYNIYSKLNNMLSGFHLDQDLRNDSKFGKHVCASCHTDLSRLKQGKVGGQFWVAYVPCNAQYKDALQLAMRQIDVIKRMIQKYPNDLQFVKKADDIETTWRQGKIASLMGVEGGHAIDSNLAVLRLFYELGVRYLTLTHSCNTPWADASPVENGASYNLTDFGVKVVLEMNRLGMMIDLSHVSQNVMRKTFAVSRAPVIFSHSSVFSICKNYRNVPDDILQLLKKNNGIVMVNFYPRFINCNSSRNATIQDVIEHINYIRNLIGVDYVGIGSDYDGIDITPEGMEDVSKYPELFDRLYDSETEPRWTKEDLEKLAGRNFIRVFKAVEAVRDSLASESPDESIIKGLDLYRAYKAEMEASGINPGLCNTALEWKKLNSTQTTEGHIH